jgi:transcriptional regulator with XRE-family HTH domain
MTPDEAFGQALRELRTARRLSQERLAHESGQDRSYISLLESGRYSPSLTTIFRLARALAIAPSALLARVEPLVDVIPESTPGRGKQSS